MRSTPNERVGTAFRTQSSVTNFEYKVKLTDFSTLIRKYDVNFRSLSNMLIDFSAQNFRSVRDKATLSFVASPDASLRASHCLSTDSFGALGHSRRSGLWRECQRQEQPDIGLTTMRTMVAQSTALTEPQFAEIYTPFRLDRDDDRRADGIRGQSRASGVRYEYGFSYNGRRILSEWLTVYRTGKGQRWFDRSWDEKDNEERWGSFSTHFSGPRETWRKATRPSGSLSHDCRSTEQRTLETAVQLVR